MGVFRPVGFLILVFIFAILGAYLIGADQASLGQIILGTAVFLLLSGLAVIALARYDRRAIQQRKAESRLLFFFRRWLMRVDGRDYDYMKFKFPQEDGVDESVAYLEDFLPAYLVEIRQIMPEVFSLSEIGVIKRLDGSPVSPDQILSIFEELGWVIYYLQRANYGQYYGYYYLKREGGN